MADNRHPPGEPPILSECGCNACHSGVSEHCENGPFWHAEADRLRGELEALKAAPPPSIELKLPEDFLYEMDQAGAMFGQGLVRAMNRSGR